MSQRERLDALEAAVTRLSTACFGEADGVPPIDQRVGQVEEDLTHLSADLDRQGGLNQRLSEVTQTLETGVAGNHDAIRELQVTVNDALTELRTAIGDIRAEVRTLQLAVANTNNVPLNGGGNGAGGAWTKIPEPRAFGGERDAKEVDNFLYDMNDYLEALHIVDEAERVRTASRYLSGDAKLWWRTQREAIANGARPINTWEEMKQRIKDHFFPHHTQTRARDELNELRHTGTIREYVNRFQELMLQIVEMSEADRIYHFQSKLKLWARSELRKHRFETLREAIEIVEGFDELYQPNPPRMATDADQQNQNFRTGNGRGGGGGTANANSPTSQIRGERGKTFTPPVQNHRDQPSTSASSSRPTGNGPARGCFYCQGPHYARDCPNYHKMASAFMQQLASLSQEEHDPLEEDGGETSEANTETMGAYAY